tara:strand:- start:719 stop:1747 length:1029 start_codon:yes stop_codon:yes gene_type:complete
MALLLERGYNTLQSGGREDLSDLIANVDARSTVFTSMAKKGKKPGNVLMGWQMDKYESPSVAGTVDGQDVTAANLVSNTDSNPGRQRKLMQNYAQIFRRSFRISSLANEIQNVAGVKSELANGIAKKLVEIKRDMELTFLNDADADADDGTNPYLTKSMGSFLHASGTGSGSDDITVPSGFRCTAIDTTASGSLTEDNVQTVLKTLFETTGEIRDYDLLLGTALKRAFTGFTQSATGADDRLAIKTFNQAAGDKSYINVVDVFEGDFGRLRLHPSTFIAEGGTAVNFKGYVIPFDQAEIRYGKLPQIKELTDNGGGPARLIEAVAALVVYNPSGFGYFNGAS